MRSISFWLVGEFTTHFRLYFSGDWDVDWGYDILTHGQMTGVDPYSLKGPPALTRGDCSPMVVERNIIFFWWSPTNGHPMYHGPFDQPHVVFRTKRFTQLQEQCVCSGSPNAPGQDLVQALMDFVKTIR